MFRYIFSSLWGGSIISKDFFLEHTQKQMGINFPINFCFSTSRSVWWYLLQLSSCSLIGDSYVCSRNMKHQCPKCYWVPSIDSRWMCECQHSWNTFETRGQCPNCKKTWTHTQCRSCNQWSLHGDWYKENSIPAS